VSPRAERWGQLGGLIDHAHERPPLLQTKNCAAERTCRRCVIGIPACAQKGWLMLPKRAAIADMAKESRRQLCLQLVYRGFCVEKLKQRSALSLLASLHAAIRRLLTTSGRAWESITSSIRAPAIRRATPLKRYHDFSTKPFFGLCPRKQTLVAPCLFRKSGCSA